MRQARLGYEASAARHGYDQCALGAPHCVELNLGEKEGDTSVEELEQLVNTASPPKAAALIELLKASEKAKLLTEGKASIADQYSLFPSPSKPIAPPVSTDDANPDELAIRHNEAAELRNRGKILDSKRKRNAPARQPVP